MGEAGRGEKEEGSHFPQQLHQFFVDSGARWCRVSLLYVYGFSIFGKVLGLVAKRWGDSGVEGGKKSVSFVDSHSSFQLPQMLRM